VKTRTTVAALALSATALVSIAVHESYRGEAYIPIPGDVPTIGFGTTKGVKMGDKIDPVTALKRKVEDVAQFEGALKQCVKVPLHQYEYDAYISLAYNIGSSAFCKSTLVRYLNEGKYDLACREILRWNKANGRVVQGLVNRREAEHKKCIGG
jgi:lysozyme